MLKIPVTFMVFGYFYFDFLQKKSRYFSATGNGQNKYMKLLYFAGAEMARRAFKSLALLAMTFSTTVARSVA